MKTTFFSALLFLVAAFGWQAGAQTYDTHNDTVQTFAGYGIPGYVDGQGQLTAFSAPSQIVSDTASNLYVWDSGNFRIRKITVNGMVSTFAGGGISFDGYGTNVSLSWAPVNAMTIDHKNTLWLVVGGNYNGFSYLVSIDTNAFVFIANGGLTNLTPSSGICVDSANNLYYTGGNRVYRYNPASGSVQAIAGNGSFGYYDGPGASFSEFYDPLALTCDQADNIYVWDSGNSLIRRIDPSQNVTTIAGRGYPYYYSNPDADGVGTNAGFSAVNSICSDNQGNIYVVSPTCIRKIDLQTNVVTLAGIFPPSSGSGSGYANGGGSQALFNSPSAGCFSQGKVFIADTGNNRIRSISFNQPSQVVPPASLQLNTYAGLQITGTIGRTYQIQSSSDMNNWNSLGLVLLSSSPYLWIDQNPVSGAKFYRAVLLP